MRSYVAKVKNRLSDKEAFERELVRHWCLFAVNSGLSSSEQRQLRWSDVSIHKENNNGDELLIRVSKGMKRTRINNILNMLFKKHTEFEKGRLTRNPNRSNAPYSLSKPIVIDSLQTAFALHDLIEQAEANGEKVNNYALAKQIVIEVEQRNIEEEWDIVYKRLVVSVAVSMKKKVAVDAIKSLVNGVFPS